MQSTQPSKPVAILLACALFQVIFVLDGFFKQPLYAYSPALYWLFDVFKFIEAIATFVYGLFASALYLKLRDLWPLIGAHIVIDLWAFW